MMLGENMMIDILGVLLWDMHILSFEPERGFVSLHHETAPFSVTQDAFSLFDDLKCKSFPIDTTIIFISRQKIIMVFHLSYFQFEYFS